MREGIDGTYRIKNAIHSYVKETGLQTSLLIEDTTASGALGDQNILDNLEPVESMNTWALGGGSAAP
jgi:hypothetical protein